MRSGFPRLAINARVHRRVEAILKVAERCNINCSYCYFFNGTDDSYKRHTPVIKFDTVTAVATFLREGVESLGLEYVQIDFHGGEPLLMQKSQFAAMCDHFGAVLEPVADLNLCLQTNAMLIDDQWIEIFMRHRVKVSTSLDGPAEYHDQERVDFKGRGTHCETIAGINRLREAVCRGDLDGFGVLCVINPARSASRIYRYFVDELGLDSMDFLLPQMTHDTFAGLPATAYGDFLCQLFDAWAADDDPRIQVRILNSVLSLLLGGRSKVTGLGAEMPLAITIASDGSVGPDDTLRTCGTAMIESGANVSSTTLAEFVNNPLMRVLDSAKENLSAGCRECCWQRVCGGGQLVHRHSARDGFNAPSVFCDGLKPFFAHVAAYLLVRGLPLGRLSEVLLGDAQALESAAQTRCVSIQNLP